MKEETSFENKIQELEEIGLELEKGNLNLNDSVAKFEKGIKLAKQCSKMLEEAEKRIMILINNEEEIIETPFNAD